MFIPEDRLNKSLDPSHILTSTQLVSDLERYMTTRQSVIS